MKSKIRVFVVALLCAMFVLQMDTIRVFAADTDYISITAQYGQTEARNMLKRINTFRTTEGVSYKNRDNQTSTVFNTNDTNQLSELKYDYNLEQIAMQRAMEIAVSYSHTRPNGQDFNTVIYNGTKAYGENIAAGYRTEEAVFEGWCEHDEDYAGQGHRRSMLNPRFKVIGIGHVYYNGYHYWVQEFSYFDSEAEPTAADDSQAAAKIEVKNSDVTSTGKIAVSKTDYQIPYGSAEELPKVTAEIRMTNTWPEKVTIQTEISADWSVKDTNIVEISDGKIIARKVGNTTLTANVDGKIQTLNVQVTAISLNEASVQLEEGPFRYNGKAVTPNVNSVVLNEQLLAKDSDYTVSYTNNVNVGTATVTVAGKGNYSGSVSKTFEILECIHNWDDGFITTQATCTQEGVKTYTCANCGETKSESISKSDHTVEIDSAVPATCVSEGKTEGRHCSVCDVILVEQRVIPKTDHVYGEWKETIHPSCTESGEREQVCKVCNDTVKETIDALGHSYGEWIVTKAATCTAEGIKTKKCTMCGTEETEALSALGHAYGEWNIKTAATCTADGVKEKVCSNCGDIISEKIAAFGHDFSEWTVYTPATWDMDGEERRTCKNCGVFETKAISKLSTDHVHSFTGEEIITRPATCTESGLKEIKCSAEECPAVKTEVINALGHKYTGAKTVVKEPTCTETGLAEIQCSAPGCTEAIRESIPAKGHSYGEWTEKKSPTCTEAGVKEKICSECNDTLIEFIDPLGHSYGEWIEAVATTCVSDGIREKACTICGDKVSETVKAPGHSFGDWNVYIPAAWDKDGEERRSCTVCGEVENRTIDKLSLNHVHDFTGVETVIKESTYTEEGSKEIHCSEELCDAVEVVKIPVLQKKEYKIIKGANSIWTMKKDSFLTIISDGEFEKFTSIEVDGKVVDADSYTAESGSTVITLKEEYVATLSVGEHSFKINFNDGAAATVFTVKKDAEKPTEEVKPPTVTNDTDNNSADAGKDTSTVGSGKVNTSSGSSANTTKNTKTTDTKTVNTKAVNTGDDTEISLLCMLLLLAVCGMAVSVKDQKQK